PFGQLLLYLADRLRAQVVDREQVRLVARGQVADRVDAFAPQAVERADGELEVLDRELARPVGGHRGPGQVAGPGRARLLLAAGRTLCGQVRRELLDDPAAHVGHHAAAELGGAAGHVHRRVRGHPGLAAALVRQPRVNRGRGRPGAARLLARRLQRDRFGLLVPLGELGLAGVGERDRAHLDLDPAGHHVTVDRVDGGARHAGRHLLDVDEHLPRALGWDRDSERVLQFHGQTPDATANALAVSTRAR